MQGVEIATEAVKDGLVFGNLGGYGKIRLNSFRGVQGIHLWARVSTKATCTKIEYRPVGIVKMISLFGPACYLNMIDSALSLVIDIRHFTYLDYSPFRRKRTRKSDGLLTMEHPGPFNILSHVGEGLYGRGHTKTRQDPDSPG